MRKPFYEADTVLAEYLLFHYGTKSQVLPYPFGPREALDFPERCVSECMDAARLPPESRALDLGCAVGRSAFELARHCDEVIAIDNSASFIGAAKELAREGALSFASRIEGDLTESVTAEVAPDIPRERVEFRVGDALDLPSDLGSFDVLLMANLIDRLPRPATLLEALPALVNYGGQLIVTSPYTWMEEFTPRDQWLGGFERDDRRVSTFETLEKILSPAFRLVEKKDLPFLIREHSRKFQWSVSQATLWRREKC